ncbi:MAG: SGNH/GDSL hydrolase family protein [Lentisphaeria bacterium]|nr:SGNH/GDSL hydrolase family protein [Lentisphaeria bacterium]
MKKTLLLLLGIAAVTLSAAGFKSGSRAVAYKIDKANNSVTVISATAYDPKKPEGECVHTLQWDKGTVFAKVSVPALSAITPGRVGICFLSAAEAAKAAKGQVFRCGRVEFEPDYKGKTGFIGKQKLATPVFPPKKGNFAETEIDGKRVRFSPGRIMVFTNGTINDVRVGENQLRIWGKEQNGKFVISRVEINPAPKFDRDPKLPDVLVAGDSISMNYEKALIAALKGKMNCRRIEGNSGDSNRGNEALKLWLGELPGKKNRWTVVVLNHGLHDLKQKSDPKTKVFDPKHQVEPDVYAKNIDRLLKYLTTNNYKVVWCTTTPVPGSSYGAYSRRKDEDLVYNKVLEPVLKKYPQVTVCDLNKVVRNSSVYDEWRKGTNVHFKEGPERELLGKAVAEAVLKAAGK